MRRRDLFNYYFELINILQVTRYDAHAKMHMRMRTAAHVCTWLFVLHAHAYTNMDIRTGKKKHKRTCKQHMKKCHDIFIWRMRHDSTPMHHHAHYKARFQKQRFAHTGPYMYRRISKQVKHASRCWYTACIIRHPCLNCTHAHTHNWT
jgi:hypothetical protein